MSHRPIDNSDFDPRFNPAFQPGFDPVLHGQTRARDVERPHGLGVPVVVDPHRAAPPPTLSVALPLGAILPQPSATVAEADDTAPATEPARSRRPDRYLIALWAVSILFIGAGLAVVRYIGTRLQALNVTGGGSSFDYYVLQVYTIAAPLLVLIGLATAVGTLFVLAARNRPR